MNDRFKFRIWNKLANMMTYNFMLGNYMQISKVDYEKKDWVGVNYEPEYICFENEGIKNIKIMQCTGLKDKNGKLIYEGDIVKITKENWKQEISHRFYIICWDRTQWQLGLIKYQRPKAQPNRRPDRKIHFKNIVSFADYTPLKEFAQCEIIGNIYENPELLKEN